MFFPISLPTANSALRKNQKRSLLSFTSRKSGIEGRNHVFLSLRKQLFAKKRYFFLEITQSKADKIGKEIYEI